MAATTTASIQFAPEDPTLPNPWRGLVDGKTGYLYFWNPQTNITQYERPTSLVVPLKSSSFSVTSSFQVQESSQGQYRSYIPEKGDDRYSRDKDGGSTVEGGSRNNQGTREGPGQSYNCSNGTIVAGHGGSPRGHGSSGGGSSLSVDDYCRQHEITVTGGEVPAPFTSFEATGLPREILREVRYLLLGGVNVVRCGALSLGTFYIIWSGVWWTNIGGGPSESPKFLAKHVVGDDSVCHSGRTEKEASSCSCLRRKPWLSAYEVQNAGFSAPTPIQAQSWPIALQSRDIVAIAKTGSGKTLGYLIPGFLQVKRCSNNPQLGPTVLVLSPTRELASQIQEEAVKFGKSSKISCTCLYGGAPKGPQLRDLDRGIDIVVATPGRLNDILEMKRISLRQVSYLVLDEADRMLDMGFEPQIRKIVKEVPARRQTLMYTATWPMEVRKIAADLLVNPLQVNIGNVELAANKSITQYVEVLSPMEKHRRLEQILRSQEHGSKIIIFCSTKKMCDQLARNLTRQFGATAIHGDKSQSERDYVLNQFRAGRSPVLVATDVAARGLDVKDIRVVINYDFPTGVEDYVHRIGRTGRAGATGVAYSFFNDQDAKHASDLIKVLEGANQQVPPEIRGMASRGGGIVRARRWGSGDGGRGGGSEFGYGGRGSSYSSGRAERGGGRGYGRESRDRYDRGYFDGNDRGHSRSRSPERFDRAQSKWERSPVRSFHQAMMEGGRSMRQNHLVPPYKIDDVKDYRNSAKSWSPKMDGGFVDQPQLRDEEEDGLLPPVEGGM